MFEKKNILITFGLFTGVNLINAAIPFLLLPILTDYLSPEEYIIIEIFQNISLFIIPIIGLNIMKSIERFYYDRDKLDFKKHISTSIYFSALTMLLLIIILLPIYASQIVFLENFPTELILLSIIYAFLFLIIEAQLSLWRVQVKPLLYGYLRIFKTFVDLGTSYYLIVHLNMTWSGRIYGLMLGVFVAGSLSIYTLWKNKWLNLSFSIKYLKQGLSFSKPLIMHTLSAYVIGFSDRLFILEMVGAKEAGIYSVAYQIGMIMSLIQNSFNQVWAPHTFKVLKDENKMGFINLMKINYLYLILIFALVPAISFSLPFIYATFINESYKAGIGIVFWVLLGYAFNGIYRMLVNYLIFIKKTKLVAINTTISAVLNLILNYIFISTFGVIGAAIATTISFITLFLLTLKSVTKYYALPWSLK